MKNKAIKVGIFTVVAIHLFASSVYAQFVDFGIQQDFAITGSGFYPFSEEANGEFKTFVSDSTQVIIIIRNLQGAPLMIAPAADGREIGLRKLVWRDNAYRINYRVPARTPEKFGLSFKPTRQNTSFVLEVQPIAGATNNFTETCGDDTSECGDNLGKYCEKNADGTINKRKQCRHTIGNNCACK